MESSGPSMLLLLLFVLPLASASNRAGFSNFKIFLVGPERGLESMAVLWPSSAPADVLAVFNSPPPLLLSRGAGSVVRMHRVNDSEDFHVMALPWFYIFPNGWEKGPRETPEPGDKCMYFWIGAYLDGKRVFSDCLKIRPTWMGDHRKALQEVPLVSVFFPPAHKSLPRKWSIERDDEYQLSLQGAVWAHLVSGIRYFHVNLTNLMGYRYIPRTQTISTLQTQLSQQIPARRENSRGMFEVNKSMLATMLITFEDIKEFLRKSPYEIIVLDIQDLSDETIFTFHQLAVCLYSVLGDYIVPLSHIFHDSTFGDIWKIGRNIILSFGDVYLENWFVPEWNRILHVGERNLPVEDLQEFLEQCFYDKSEATISKFRYINVTASTDIEAPTGEKGIPKWFEKYSFGFDNNSDIQVYLGLINDGFPVIACVDKSNNTIFRQYYGQG